MSDRAPLEASIVLAAYAEPVLAGKRVLVFGNALSALPEQLLARGARLVHVCDPDPLRIAQASARNGSAQLSFSPLTDGDLAVRESSFELVLVDNLGSFDALSVLRKARRALTLRGAVLVAAPNPDVGSPLLEPSDPRATALDYYALYDAVAAEFDHVRMLGQTPFVGYAVVDFSVSSEPEPALDTGFVPSGAEEPDIFLALGSMHELALDEYSVVQLPTRALLEAATGASDGAALHQARAGERRARMRIAELETALRRRPEAPNNSGAAREIERLNLWITELEARASTADERADQAEAELEDTRGRAEAERGELKTRVEELERELAEARTALGQVKDTLQQRDQSLARQSAELEAARVQVRELSASAEQGVADELSGAERQLQERGNEVRRLERELRAAERTGRELVRELSRRSPAAADPELLRKLSEREADLQAADWTIDSLGERLAELERANDQGSR